MFFQISIKLDAKSPLESIHFFTRRLPAVKKTEAKYSLVDCRWWIICGGKTSCRKVSSGKFNGGKPVAENSEVEKSMVGKSVVEKSVAENSVLEMSLVEKSLVE